ncbi:LysR family transcriptional regulator [Vibrio sp. McD22-P3]|uniref:LysR family transcriptional regulator n=1 Tax=Vibrio sp. McD22-P3 TaxID=2724880 RepID=UPI001F2F2BFC|nr:LysR family transcriptional regulator [Vibrio sp. McD22-P3]MCF4175864.1 LysR family transcriptional regulator [Vibrio sp. McD22-P3]
MNDLNALRVFLTLMQTQSTLKTAKALGRSQSYVSKTLAQLRIDLADPLFVRSAEGLSPTSYAQNIEPKLKSALADITDALKPDTFNPKSVDKITLHIIEPYLIGCGKEIINAIRTHTSAPIEIRQWNKGSESLLLTEEVDLAVHALTDKPQSIYQKYIHTGTGVLYGNTDGEYVKYMVADLNEHIDWYKLLDSDAQATIFVDNHALMTQLMEQCYTLRYITSETPEKAPLHLDMAILTKASRKNEEKVKWLIEILEPILRRYTPLSYSNTPN